MKNLHIRPTRFYERSADGRSLTLRRGLSLCASVLALGAQAAHAQDAAAPASSAEASGAEIIVTAQKRGERLLDVPVAVTAIKADELVTRNLTTAKDYLISVPGVQVNARQAGRSQISIRGITSGNGGNPLVGIAIDDIPFGSSTLYGQGASIIPDLDPFILSNVEVLRGPQGTLYGASSMGGLIKFQTRAPSLTEMSGAVQAGVNGATDGGLGYSIRGAVNAPLVAEQVAVSVSGFYRRDAGFIKDPGLGRKNQDAVRAYGGRISLLAQISDTFKARLSALYQNQRADVSSQMDVDINGDPIDGDLTHRRLIGTDGLRSKVQFYSAILENDFGPVTLSSLTGYARSKLLTPLDNTRTDGPAAVTFLGNPNLGVRFDNQINTRKFTEELRLTSNGDGPISYIAGLFYGDEKSLWPQTKYAIDPVTGALLAPPFSTVVVNSSYREYAAYATVTWAITPDFDLIAGGRYSHNKGSTLEDDDIFGNVSQSGGKNTENPFTFNVSTRYHFSRNLMVYARIASGYRAGGANSGPPALTNPSFKSDTLVNYEVGIKGQTDDGLLSGSLAAYYIDWKKIQVSLVDPSGSGLIGNAAKAKSEGVEAELTLRPVEGLSLSGTATYNKAILTEDAPAGSFFGFDGDRLPYSAKWTATIAAQYTVPVSDSLSAFVGGNLLYTGHRLSDFVANNTQTRFDLPAYTTVDLRAGVEHEKWTLAAFVKNVGNSRGLLGARPLFSRNRPPFAVSIVTPRTIGASLTARF